MVILHYFNIYISYKMWYFCRWTSDYESKESIASKMPSHYLISKEYSRREKLHFHIVMFHEDPRLTSQWFYDNFKHERKGMSVCKVDAVGPTDRDLDQVSTYTVKDNDFIHSDFFSGDRIKKYVANSYEKPSTVTAKIQQAIDEELEEDIPNWRELWKTIARIKSEFGLEVYPNKITARVLGVMILHDIHNDILEDLVSKEKLFSK